MGLEIVDLDWLERKLESLHLTDEGEELAIRAFKKSGLLGDPDWSNVVRHCVRAAEVAEAIAATAGSKKAAREVSFALLLHDIKKKVERERANELIAASMEDIKGIEDEEVRRREEEKARGAAFTQAAEEQAEWLRDVIGVRPEIMRLSSLSGHSSLVHFKYGDPSPEEKLFHVADDLCGGPEGDTVVMLSDRIAALRERYDFLADGGRDLLGGESYIEAQERIATEILEELAELAGIETGEKLNRQLVQKFAVG